MSDDSDDDLFSAPAFRRSTRKETAKETKAMKILDSILDQSEMKMNQQVRMNEMILEGKRGFVPSKEDMELGIGSSSGDVSPAVSVIGKDNDDPSPRPTKIAKTEMGSGNVTGEGGGNDNQKAHDDGGDDEDAGGERSFPLRAISPSEIKTTVPVPVQFDTKDPEYWSKIDSIVAASAEKKISTAQRRKFLMDRIDDCYESSEEYDGRNPSSLDDNQRDTHKEQKFAEENGMHSTLGMRRTLGWHRDEKESLQAMSELSSCFSRFGSSEDAIAKLENLMNKYDSPLPRNVKSNEEHTKRWISFRDRFAKPMKQVLAINIRLLPHILERKWPEQVEIIPEDYVMWLIQLAISGVQSEQMYCNEAKSMVINVFQQGIPISRFGEEKVEGVTHLLQLKELPIMLHSLFGLWTEGCKERPLAQCAQDRTESNLGAGAGSFDNPYGLYNALAIWSAAIDKGAVRLVDDVEEAKKDLSQCIAMLLQCGIDPIFYSGRNLLEPKAELIESLLTLAYKQFSTRISDNGVLPADFLTWMGQTCNLTLGLCCNRKLEPLKTKGIHRTKSENGKVHEFLTSDLVVRSWQDVDQQNEVFATFYYILSKRVLEKCLEDEIDLNNKSQELAIDLKKSIDDNCTIENLSLQFRAIASVEYTFKALVGSDVAKEASMLLATVGIANHCEQIGIALFAINIQKKGIKSSAGICESESEAAMLFSHFDRLIGHCTDLKKTVKGICNNLNMQRSLKLLSQLMAFYREGKDLAGKWGKCGEASKKKRQSNVSDFFSKVTKKCDSDDDDSTL